MKTGNAGILDSYAPERIAFARKLVATTDRVFRPMVAPGVEGNFLPQPARAGGGAARDLVRHDATARLSHAVADRDLVPRQSALSEGRAARIAGGDRLPFVPADGGDNFAPLASLDWQVHVYGGRGAGGAGYRCGNGTAAAPLRLEWLPRRRPG